MSQATLEFISDSSNKVCGGGRPAQRQIADGYDINCGLCEEWAGRVAELSESGVEVLDASNLTGDPDDSIEYGHVFIRHAGLFYDAECPTGVINWKDLPLIVKRMDSCPILPSESPRGHRL